VPETVERVTIAAAIDAGTRDLERNGVPFARREATALWAACAGLPPADVFLRREQAADPHTTERFETAVRRRAEGVPHAYVVGGTAFRRIELATDPRALIPRPETEGLVDLVLRWAAAGGSRRGIAADIGTGSGCIALSLAVEGPFERVVAVDISPGATALAQANVARVNPPVPVEVRLGDLLAPLAGRRCRAIVANPPYLTEAEWETLDAAVRHHEPRQALVSGPDGLAATRAILAGARACLEPEGLLALEVDERRAAAARELAAAAGWTGAAVHLDLFGRPRYLLAHLS